MLSIAYYRYIAIHPIYCGRNPPLDTWFACLYVCCTKGHQMQLCKAINKGPSPPPLPKQCKFYSLYTREREAKWLKCSWRPSRPLQALSRPLQIRSSSISKLQGQNMFPFPYMGASSASVVPSCCLQIRTRKFSWLLFTVSFMHGKFTNLVINSSFSYSYPSLSKCCWTRVGWVWVIAFLCSRVFVFALDRIA